MSLTHLSTSTVANATVLAAGLLLATAGLEPAGARPDVRPDLRIERVSAPASSVRAGAALHASALARETRGRRAPTSTTGFFLSHDRRFGRDDAELGRVRQAPLRPRTARPVAATLRVAPGIATGRYVLLACADARHAVHERSERNNCTAAKAVLIVQAAGAATGAAPTAVPSSPLTSRPAVAPSAASPASGAAAPAPAGPSCEPSPRQEQIMDPNPFAGRRLYVDPESVAAVHTSRWSVERPQDAALIDTIATQPQALWLGGGTDIQAAVAQRVCRARAENAMALFVAYNIPGRDCGQHSSGGAASAEEYRAWIRDFAAGLGSGRDAVVLEPDALAQLCSDDRGERLALLAEAVRVLAGDGRTAVYLDAGHAGWQPPGVMADRLRAAGIADARGFSLNVSNFGTAEEEIAYGTAVSTLLGGTPFVVDTSRNGAGRTTLEDWCNPAGRALGAPPTADTGDPLVDALLWIKNPGESDGGCNGGPGAGRWWPEYALGLAQRATW